MSLIDGLVAAYLMGNNSPPFLQTDYVGSLHLNGSLIAGSTDGENGPAVLLDKTHGPLTHASASPFIMAGPTTMAIRFKLNSLAGGGMFLVAKGAVPATGPDYSLFIEDIGGGQSLIAFFLWMNVVGGFPSSATVSVVVPQFQVGQWQTIIFGFDPAAADSGGVTGNFGNNFVIFGNQTPVYSAATGPAITGNAQFQIGAAAGQPTLNFDGVIDSFYIWKRLLVGDEIVAVQAGPVWPFSPATADCGTIPCCAPLEPAPYSASNPTPSGATNNQSLCDPVPMITFQPTPGSAIGPPTYVVLSCNRPDVTIYYTTDGTTPTVTSTVYTAPFQIQSTKTVVQAFALVAGCDNGPIAAASYVPFKQGNFTLGYLCDTPDLVGQWGVFAPNAHPDYHWQLLFTLTGNTDIVRIEMYQTDAKGHWNSGQAWATDEFINPTDGPANFHVFPLEVWDEALAPACTVGIFPPACGQQLNAVYKTDFGTFAAGTYVWDLYGQPAYALFGFFKVKVFLGDGTVLEQIISTVCTPPPPPPCPNPNAPTLVPGCNKIDVTFANTVGLPYQLLKAVTAPCGDSVFRIVSSGNIATNPQTFHDTGLDASCKYCYYLNVQFPGCGFTSSTEICGQPLCLPQVSIAASIVQGCHGDTVVLSYSSNCIVGNITIQDDNGGAPITKPGNTSGTVTVAITAAANGNECWTISGSNPCGSATNKTCVAVLAPGCDLTNPPSTVSIDGFVNAPLNTTFFGSGPPCAGPKLDANGTGHAWSGTMAWVGPGNCSWSLQPGDELWVNLEDGSTSGYLAIIDANVFFDFSNNVWALVVSFSNPNGGTDLIWVGIKLCGKGPQGPYTKTGGCASGPAAFNIV